MRKLAGAIAMVWMLAAADVAAQPRTLTLDEFSEPAWQNARRYEPPVIQIPWRVDAPDLVRLTYASDWTVEVVVDEAGAVVEAVVKSGPAELRAEAAAAARTLRFQPFAEAGDPVRARFDVYVMGRPEGYQGPPDRTFPAGDAASDLRIRLARTACFGTCPEYEVEINGAGEVRYVGGGSVLIRGEHRWRIPRENVAELLTLFRNADYFNLRDHYEINASDLPTYITSIRIDGREKFVSNYGGAMGEAVASTAMGPISADDYAPRAVMEIEAAIDRLSGADRFVRGNGETITALRAQGWNFRGRDAGNALAELIAGCNLGLARAFLAEGTPARARYYGFGGPEGRPVLPLAAFCGDAAFVEELIRRGGAPSRGDAERLMDVAAGRGFPAIAEIALRYSRSVNRMDRHEEQPLIFSAVAPMPPSEYRQLGLAHYNPGRVVELLLAAGANVRTVDEERNTALHMAMEDGAVRHLLAAGADPNARNAEGETPLFNRYSSSKALLLAAGADPLVRSATGRTPLFGQYSAASIAELAAAGIDVNARDSQGRTALLDAGNQEVALALIAAGAALPDDPQQLRTFMRRARTLEWADLLARLQAHAAALGVAESLTSAPE